LAILRNVVPLQGGNGGRRLQNILQRSRGGENFDGAKRNFVLRSARRRVSFRSRPFRSRPLYIDS
jgi:hypothetical protein